MTLVGAEVRVPAELVVRVRLLHRTGAGAFLSYTDDALLAVIATLELDEVELGLHPPDGSADGTG